MKEDIRIVLLDPHPLVRLGLVHHLGALGGLSIVAEFGEPQAFFRYLGAHEVDVAVVDCFRARHLHGAGAVLDAVRALSSSRLVVFAAEAGQAARALCRRAGADAFVDKREHVDKVAAAIRSVCRSARRPPMQADAGFLQAGLGRLTPHEDRVMRLVADGRSTTQIALALQRTKSTVSTHKVNALAKLQLGSERDFLRLLPPHFQWPQRR